jgi:hypothetical protein
MLKSTRLDLIIYSINFIKLLISFTLNDSNGKFIFCSGLIVLKSHAQKLRAAVFAPGQLAPGWRKALLERA